LNVGSLQPKQTAQVNLQIISRLKVYNGAFDFGLPAAILPLYKDHKVSGICEGERKVFIPNYTYEC
jgi:hypothetical protein